MKNLILFINSIFFRKISSIAVESNETHRDFFVEFQDNILYSYKIKIKNEKDFILRFDRNRIFSYND